MADWIPGRWWRVLDTEGRLWCETSDEIEARESMKLGYTLQRQWVYQDSRWENV